ncbi:hypothetical protein Q1695_012582 [Nippostrongylus brasiliensis]|nr:hypothetical protein Q1695_012582 [Nippostrongylus brasiliensis]
MPQAEEAPPILESEVAYAIRRMKPGPAPGPDGISAELLRAGGGTLCSLVAKHFNHYLRLGRIPSVWKESGQFQSSKKASGKISATTDPSAFSRLSTRSSPGYCLIGWS